MPYFARVDVLECKLKRFSGDVHSSLEAVYVFKGLVADCEWGVKDEGFVGRFIPNLEPGVVFYIDFGFAVPAGEGFTVLVNLPTSFDERASSEEDIPS